MTPYLELSTSYSLNRQDEVYFEGSTRETEIIFKYFAQGDRCLKLREHSITLFQVGIERVCLGEVLFDFVINTNWRWKITKNKGLSSFVFESKSQNIEQVVQFWNALDSEKKTYSKWDRTKLGRNNFLLFRRVQKP